VISHTLILSVPYFLLIVTLCGAYALKHAKTRVSFEEVYKDLLKPKLGEETRSAGFRPLGGSGGLIMAQTVTSDIRASKIMQQKGEADVLASQEEKSDSTPGTASKVFKTFKGHCVLGDVVGTSPISGAGLRTLPVLGAPSNVYAYVIFSLCRVSERS
jgi:hypothetical protein